MGMDNIDVGTFAGRPAPRSSTEGKFYLARDTDQLFIQEDGAWALVADFAGGGGGAGIGAIGSRNDMIASFVSGNTVALHPGPLAVPVQNLTGADVFAKIEVTLGFVQLTNATHADVTTVEPTISPVPHVDIPWFDGAAGGSDIKQPLQLAPADPLELRSARVVAQYAGIIPDGFDDDIEVEASLGAYHDGPGVTFDLFGSGEITMSIIGVPVA